MKKFVQFSLAFFVFSVFCQSLIAQCTVNNILITRVSSVQNGTGVDYNIDVEFTASTNGGNKRVYFHVWKEAEYPAAKMSVFNCTGNQSVAPAPAKYDDGNQRVDVLDNAFLNFGFDINAISTFPTFSATGIFPNYNAYDVNVILNAVGATISKENIGSDLDRIRINNLQFTVPNFTDGDFLQVRPFNWATNGTTARPQCWGCNPSLVIGDPTISGSVNCQTVNGQRTFNIFIDSKYDDLVVPGIEPINGTYQLYIDVDNSGEVTPGDILAHTSTAFQTSVPGPSGYKTRYAALNQSLNNYVYGVSDPNATKPLVAVVTVTTPGYLGGGTSGLLSNTCAGLPVSLKNFNAVQRSGKAFLSWDTDQENNNDGFEIERRSAGNSQYQKIGFIDSKAPGGTGGAFSYSFDDNQSLAKGVTYYRLRQVDLDGRATYSEVKAVRAGNGGLLTISIYPNPSRGTTNVTIPESAGKMDVSLDDYTGKSIQRWSGISVRNLQLNNMQPGIYMLRINFRESGETIVERIIVQ